MALPDTDSPTFYTEEEIADRVVEIALKKMSEATESPAPSGQTELLGYKPGWYWMTVVSEGDTWYPIYINEEYFLMDGKRKDLGTLKDLIVKPAIMPTGL